MKPRLEQIRSAFSILTAKQFRPYGAAHGHPSLFFTGLRICRELQEKGKMRWKQSVIWTETVQTIVIIERHSILSFVILTELTPFTGRAVSNLTVLVAISVCDVQR